MTTTHLMKKEKSMNFKKLALLSALAVALIIGSGVRKAAAATTIFVDDDLIQCPTATFTSISAAVAVASPGDTIQVCAGTYNEVVQLSKTLPILGAQDTVDAST